MRRPDLDHVLQITKRTIAETKADRVSTLAAGLAFHWFLALFPAIVVLIGVGDLVGFTGVRLHGLVHGITQVMPGTTGSVITQALQQHPSKGTGVWEIVIGSIIALWSATEAMACLQVGLDVAFEVSDDRGYLGRRMMGVPLLLLTIVLGGTASAVLVFGDPIRNVVHNVALLMPSFDVLWDIIRWSVAAVLGAVLMSSYYAIGPKRERFEWRFFTVGGFVAIAGWLVASLGFSFYVGHLGHAANSYGTFAGVAILLLWLYVTALMVLVGAEVNDEIAKARAAGA